MHRPKPKSHTSGQMRNFLMLGVAIVAMSLCAIAPAIAQDSQEAAVASTASTVHNTLVKMPQGSVVVPGSSVRPTTNGTTLKTRLASTDLLLYVPAGWKPSEVSPPRPAEAPPYPGYAYETPASLACIYSLVATTTGCNPNTVTKNPTGGTRTIAIVDAYDDPWAGPDLAYFSDQFGIPFSDSQFQVVYENGVQPALDITGGWEIEESLDIEYSHAEAPSARIYLVEAQSNSFADLLTSVKIASNLVRCGATEQNLSTLAVGTCPTTSSGAGEVSMSWGGGEFSTETAYDSYFTTTEVVYFASTGDSPGTEWPSVSPNVVGAGGTTLRRNPSTGAFLNEVAWDSGGGGESFYEKSPSYQSKLGYADRVVPDVSLDANPITGVWVWDSNYFEELGGGWFIVGGTSVASPNWAGIVNRAGTFAASSNAELTNIYSHLGVATDFRDITAGFCGPYDGYAAVTGWDPCTGVGSDVGYTGK
jgi:kumamolisin